MHVVVLLSYILGAVETQPIPLQPGDTRLTEVGIYSVGYTRFNGSKGTMPSGWVGHFHGPTGISYTPYGRQDGKECLLIHSPWRGGAGTTYAEYAFLLPDAKPITFETAIAMKSDVTVPDRSDGSDFHVSISTPGGDTKLLLNEHYKSGEWKPLSFDLTPHAGKQIVLRLQVGPGPNKSPSWDYSFFGDPRIVVGAVSARKAPRPIWTGGSALKRLGNRRDLDCCPTGPAVGNTSLRWDQASGVARYDVELPADRATLTYTVRTRRDAQQPADGFIDIRASVTRDNGKPGPDYRLGVGSAIMLTDGEKTWDSESPEVLARPVGSENSAHPDRPDKLLRIVSDHIVDTIRARVAREFRLRGASLMVTVSSSDTNVGVGEIRFGAIAAPLRRPVSVPYLGLGPVWYLPDAQLFNSLVLDWTNSRATRHDGCVASYGPTTKGRRNTVKTTAYYTLSPRVGEVLCNLPFQPSPFLDDLSGRIMFDVWGGKYRDDAAWFADLATYGVLNAAIIKHVWQRSGYDNALPNHVPANKGLGGDDDMAHYVDRTRGMGHRSSLHENYVDFYPNSELFDANDVSLDPAGKQVLAWFNGGTRIQSYGAKPTAIMKYARIESPEIHRRYGTNASYLDVHTCVPPWFHVDHRDGEPGAATFSAVFNAHAELFAFERKTHKGPLFGEGNNHFFWAGMFDGAEAQVMGGEQAQWLVDFDLLKIHPQMVNHGMGYLERWFKSGYGANWYSRLPSTRALDKYRAMELAFGHAGFVAQQIWHQLPYVLREYYMVTPVQKRYAAARPTKILYDVDGKMLPASHALAAGPLSNRLHVEYDNGLKLWCNGSPSEWTIPAGTLCDYGFRAEADDMVATTTIWPTLDGKQVVADFRRGDDVIFADARAHEPSKLAEALDVTPSVQSFKSTGPRSFEITYKWRMRRPNTIKWLCFVHFTSSREKGTDHIAFQNDHGLPKPIATWKAGETIVDGPHGVIVPADTADGNYDVAIGLHSEFGRAPLPFKPDGRGRYVIGTVTVKGDKVTFAHRKLESLPPRLGPGPYNGHTNPAGAMVDFGVVATNGCVAVRHIRDAWRVTVYPRDKAFRIRLDMDKLDPDAPPGPWRVEMLDNSERSCGLADTKVDGTRIEWRTGQKNAIYYRVGK